MEKTSITILLPAGRLPLELMQKVNELVREHDFCLYLSQQQNLRLINVDKEKVDEIKEALAPLKLTFKQPGLFPLPRVCVGSPHCNMGNIDTEELSSKIMDRFGDREKTKAKLKISIAACPLDCSWSKNSDIGIVASKVGYTVYAGGKGGSATKTGRRIKVKIDEQELLDTIATLVEFHDRKTKSKQRLFKLLSDPEFPFAEV